MKRLRRFEVTRNTAILLLVAIASGGTTVLRAAGQYPTENRRVKTSRVQVRLLDTFGAPITPVDLKVSASGG